MTFGRFDPLGNEFRLNPPKKRLIRWCLTGGLQSITQEIPVGNLHLAHPASTLEIYHPAPVLGIATLWWGIKMHPLEVPWTPLLCRESSNRRQEFFTALVYDCFLKRWYTSNHPLRKMSEPLFGELNHFAEFYRRKITNVLPKNNRFITGRFSSISAVNSLCKNYSIFQASVGCFIGSRCSISP